MEWLSNLSFSDIMSIITGIILLFYLSFQGFKKACGDMDWYKERQKAKKDKQLKEQYEDYKLFREWNKEERKKNFSEFYAEYRQNHKKQDEEYLKGLYNNYTKEFVEKYEKSVIGKIEATDKAQNEKIDKLITSSNDMLRKELVTIYYHYLPYKKITIYMKKSFMKLYEDYHEQGGNSFIDDIHNQVINWDVVDTEEEAVREVKN